ncbi:protein phosphatase CheZ [uncultured Paraglaciecola sp.]|uniref:protein phosphatase CheZ n=1 Tax=uncultured Paraglaciecola sp. TaxID=1765024 RepID=UPI0030D70746|tara:strand:+ start:25259 stop:26002 length:744 start_codon:yes stop_codon:yes gene_type:complete
MTSSSAPMSLEDAKQLVVMLENGDNQSARKLLDSVNDSNSVELFEEVGKLTRQLHDSLNNFQLDERIANIANEEIPDAKTRLTYVIETTEKAANRTMDLVDSCMPIAEKFNSEINAILPEWKKLLGRQLAVGEFNTLCHRLDTFLEEGEAESSKLHELLTEMLLAQGYQDITGQVIRRVIELVKVVEDSLVHMLTMFGGAESLEITHISDKQADSVKAEGPIIDAANRDDVASDQDDVDDLLSSLGF